MRANSSAGAGVYSTVASDTPAAVPSFTTLYMNDPPADNLGFTVNGTPTETEISLTGSTTRNHYTWDMTGLDGWTENCVMRCAPTGGETYIARCGDVTRLDVASSVNIFSGTADGSIQKAVITSEMVAKPYFGFITVSTTGTAGFENFSLVAQEDGFYLNDPVSYNEGFAVNSATETTISLTGSTSRNVYAWTFD